LYCGIFLVCFGNMTLEDQYARLNGQVSLLNHSLKEHFAIRVLLAYLLPSIALLS